MKWLALAGAVLLPTLLLWWRWLEERAQREAAIIDALVEFGWLNSTQIAVAIGLGDDVRRVEHHLLRLYRRGELRRTVGGQWELAPARLATEHARAEERG